MGAIMALIHDMVYRKYFIRGIEILHLGDASGPSGEVCYYRGAMRGRSFSDGKKREGSRQD